MQQRKTQLQLGIGAIVAAAFLILFAIPQWISAPSNVPKIVLSPLFWPYVISAMTGLVGIGLILSGLRQEDGAEAPDVDDRRAALIRMAIMTVILLVTFWALPILGLVWTAMLTFVATAFLVKTRHPVTAVVCAVIIPLVLYAFFAHVAGVAIPQGNFVRLP